MIVKNISKINHAPEYAIHKLKREVLQLLDIFGRNEAILLLLQFQR